MYLASGSHFYSNAEEQARYVADHDPNNPEGYVLLGNVLLAQKHYDDALVAFSKAIAIKPNDPSAYMNRGAVYVFLKQDDAAEKDFKKAVEIDPHSLAGLRQSRRLLPVQEGRQAGRRRLQATRWRTIPIRRCRTCVWPACCLREGRKDEGEAVVQQLALQAALLGRRGFVDRRLLPRGAATPMPL